MCRSGQRSVVGPACWRARVVAQDSIGVDVYEWRDVRLADVVVAAAGEARDDLGAESFWLCERDGESSRVPNKRREKRRRTSRRRGDQLFETLERKLELVGARRLRVELEHEALGHIVIFELLQVSEVRVDDGVACVALQAQCRSGGTTLSATHRGR